MFIKSRLIEQAGALGLQTTRTGGVSPFPKNALNFGSNVGDDKTHIQQNIEILSDEIYIAPEKMVHIHQVHGDKVCIHDPETAQFQEADAVISHHKGFFVTVKTADCFPVLLLDPKQKAVGAIHNGWRGTQQQITPKTIDRMRKEYGTEPKDLIAWIGVGISADAYEVSAEVQQQFAPQYAKPSNKSGHFYLDLRTCLFEQLLAAGVPLEQIEVADFCTFNNNDQFFSHRRESGNTGRMISGICLKDS